MHKDYFELYMYVPNKDIHRIKKISPMSAGDKKGKNFLQAKTV